MKVSSLDAIEASTDLGADGVVPLTLHDEDVGSQLKGRESLHFKKNDFKE